MTSQHQGVVPLFEIIFKIVSSVLKIPPSGGKYKGSVIVTLLILLLCGTAWGVPQFFRYLLFRKYT
jgi:hypothetical protein